MTEPHRPPVSETELDVLKVLWEFGPGTVRELGQRLRDQDHHWAYTTVLTLLQRLATKGYVTSDKTDLAHVFHAAVTREGMLRQRLKDLANQLCEGTATPLVQALVEGQPLSAGEIQYFRELLDRLESKKPGKSPTKK
jgi:predicted transcriptional regulator